MIVWSNVLCIQKEHKSNLLCWSCVIANDERTRYSTTLVTLGKESQMHERNVYDVRKARGVLRQKLDDVKRAHGY